VVAEIAEPRVEAVQLLCFTDGVGPELHLTQVIDGQRPRVVHAKPHDQLDRTERGLPLDLGEVEQLDGCRVERAVSVDGCVGNRHAVIAQLGAVELELSDDEAGAVAETRGVEQHLHRVERELRRGVDVLALQGAQHDVVPREHGLECGRDGHGLHDFLQGRWM